jgi:cyclohexa-1,5-dienecarbonyl-CoA hydratase
MAMLDVRFDADRSRTAFTFSHPKGNIITADIVAALRTGLEALGQHPHLKLITIEGQGADFSFGASVPEHAPDRIGRVLPEMHALVEDLLAAPAVTAAIVRGRCLGGGFELALACDLIFASDDATFGLPEIALGVFPPAASVLLPLRAGYARAARAILTGESRPATEWRDAGLVELIAPAASLDGEVDRWFAQHLAPRSAVSLRHAAASARAGLVAHVRSLLPGLERLYLQELMSTHDAAEGIAAFLEKRRPIWTDR